MNISLQNNTMHLRVAPYQVLWLDLGVNKGDETLEENGANDGE